MNDPRPMSDDECALWYCQRCLASGVVFVAGAGVYPVLEEIHEAHREESPVCHGTPPGRDSVRLARATSWFKDAAELAQMAEYPLRCGHCGEIVADPKVHACPIPGRTM